VADSKPLGEIKYLPLSFSSMARTKAERLRDAIEMLETAVEERDCSLVEDALEELRALLEELEE